MKSLLIDTSDVTTNSYIACMYEGKVWFGNVEERSEEFGDCFIKFTHLSGGVKRFIFREKDDTCWVCENDIRQCVR